MCVNDKGSITWTVVVGGWPRGHRSGGSEALSHPPPTSIFSYLEKRLDAAAPGASTFHASANVTQMQHAIVDFS
uniref:Uncharacterized protein n=1 Tax=Panagrellus redivivus TaxID=6233 RepID=A0A7E4ZPZ2_PANRE